MSNFLHLEFREIASWGGPLLNLYCNKDSFEAENSDFYSLYGYVKEDIDYPNRTYPIYIHGTDSSNEAWMNLSHFYRIQISTVPEYPNAQSGLSVFFSMKSSPFTILSLKLPFST